MSSQAKKTESEEEKDENRIKLSSSSPEKKRSRFLAPPTAESQSIREHEYEGQLQSQPGSSSSVDQQNSAEIPFWVAGASPAKFVSLGDLIKMNDSVQKMSIVHKIAVDPKCTVEDLKPKDPLYEKVKSSMHEAYWDLLREDLTKDPPNNEHTFSLLVDLKKMIKEHLESSNLMNTISAVDDALDIDHLKKLLQRRALNLWGVLNSVLAILEKLCAPIRDEFVAELKQEEDLVNLFKGMFNLVELMQLDMANFTLSQNRQLIGSYSSKIEFDEFIKLLEIDKSAAHNTKIWLRRVLRDLMESATFSERKAVGNELSRADVNQMISEFYMALLCNPPTVQKPPFPETMKMDQQQIEALGENLLQLELIAAALFVASNLVGREMCEATTFKAKLKGDLIAIMNDVNWNNIEEKLVNVYMQCEKKCKESCDVANVERKWKSESSQLLRNQLNALSRRDDPVRTVSRNRLCDFMRQVLRQRSEPLRIPPGIGVLQTELASLASRFYAIVLHNWNTYGRFYGQTLEVLFVEECERRARVEDQKQT